MATYYWVGGSGTWDNTSTTNWAASSGGAGGAGPPVAADSVIFDANSGTGTCTTAATATATNVTLNSANLGLTLGANLSISAQFTLTAGEIDLNGYTFSVLAVASNNANTRSIAFGATGQITLNAPTTASVSWDIRDLTGFTCTGSKSVLITSAASINSTVYHRGTAAAEAKAISLKVSAPSGTLILAGTSIFLNLDLSAFASTTAIGNVVLTIYGDLTLAATNVFTAGTNGWTFGSTNASARTITSAGVTLDFPVTFNGVGGSWKFSGAFAIGSTRALTLTNGTLDGNGQNVSIGTFALGSGTKTLTLGSGTWTVAGASWNANTNVTGLTVSASTGTISMTSGSAKTFSGGGRTWPTLNQGGAGTLTIAQSNTFANITDTVQPATVRLTAGTTQTVSALGLAGTSGNLITLDTTVAGTKATIYKASGSVSLAFVSLKDIAATGGANFNAFTSSGCVDAGGNTGWDFNSVLYPTIYTVRKTKRYFLN